MEKVVIRSFNPELDSGLIYSSYPKGVYYGAFEKINPDGDPKIKSDWFKSFFVQVRKQLSNSKVIIACMSDNFEVIIGYAIITDKKLEFIYVKELFRNQGIARMMLKNHEVEEYSHITKVGNSILIKEGSKYARRSSRENAQECNFSEESSVPPSDS